MPSISVTGDVYFDFDFDSLMRAFLFMARVQGHELWKPPLQNKWQKRTQFQTNGLVFGLLCLCPPSTPPSPLPLFFQ